MSNRAPMMNRVSRAKRAAHVRKALWLAKCRENAAQRWGLDPEPPPVTLPYVSIQHVDMEKLP